MGFSFAPWRGFLQRDGFDIDLQGFIQRAEDALITESFDDSQKTLMPHDDELGGLPRFHARFQLAYLSCLF